MVDHLVAMNEVHWLVLASYIGTKGGKMGYI